MDSSSAPLETGDGVASGSHEGSVMKRQIDALQMSMSRLTSAMREATLQAESNGPRGPPAYEEDAGHNHDVTTR